MGRRTISELEDQLEQERADNERLYTKVENLRAELSGVAESADEALEADDASDEDSGDDSDSESSDEEEAA